MTQKNLYTNHTLVCSPDGKISEIMYVDSKEYLLRYMEDYEGIRRFTCWSAKIECIDNEYEHVGYYGYD